MPYANFNYCNPTRILFGQNAIEKLDLYLPKDKTFIICYGQGSIKRSGLYDKLIQVLGERKYEDFPGIEPNPDFDTLMKCVSLCKKIGTQNVFLIAVGGGSIADGVKFIAAASLYKGDPWKMILESGKNITEAVPMACILTLPARKQSFASEKVFPVVSVLDPDYMLTLPMRQIQNGVVDAMVHVCEQYVTCLEDTDCHDRYCEGLIKTLVVNGQRIMKDQKDYVARSNIMWAANQALNKLIAQGVKEDWATHQIGHELTANLGLDHGQTLVIIQPRLFEYKLEEKKDKLAMLGEAVFGITTGTVTEKAKATIVAIESFYRDTMKMKTKISELECSQDKAWIEAVCNRLEEDKVALGENRNITHTEVKYLLDRCY